MWILGPIGFTAPWLLLGLLVLPVLWILLRAVPPAPIRRRFPGVALLLGLTDDENQTDKTPWWLLLLRMLAVAALIVGFAGPVLNPKSDLTSNQPLLVLADGTWADAHDWQRRMDRVQTVLESAARQGRPAAVVVSTSLPSGAIPFQAAGEWASRLPGITPNAWRTDGAALLDWFAQQDGRFDTYWLSDGLAYPAREQVLASLLSRGDVRIFETGRALWALRPAVFEDGAISLQLDLLRGSAADGATIVASGRGPGGAMRDLLQEQVEFDAGANSARVLMDLPPELRNRISRFSVLGARSAGAVTLTDDSLKRREVALIAGTDNREGLELLSPLHYLRQALEPTADLIDGNLLDILLANPDVLVLADVARVAPGEEAPLLDWVNNGGLLVRFAGPRLAASDVSRAEEDVLMPVRLRSGGRSIGGAMSWGEPKKLQPFRPGTPFYGLNVPDEVDISAQVVAQPGPDLAERTIAALSDGTPLVTRKSIGAGQVVLFHVTANAEWSSLPLSGLFVQMLERLAVSTRPAQLDATELAGTNWQAEALIDAFGAVAPNDQPVAITGDVLAQRAPGLANPPGLYSSNERRVALNAVQADELLAPAIWPAGVVIDGGEESRETGLKGALLAAAILLFAADAIASLLLTGRLRGRRAATAAIVVFCMGVFAAPPGAQAQPIEEDAAIAATSEVVLAYVVTGNPGLDDVSRAGMYGLSRKLFQRTSVEPADPVAVNLETDELAFFPFIYWPVSISQPLPSAEAYTKLNRYLRSGGMIMFDTRDADTSRFGGSSPSARRLQEIARPLDIPPLEPIPEDHVLTRTFYLLQDFPGRFASRDVWVEAAPADAEQVEGIPFRNLNDNVTPVVVGGNDWASAWATDANGMQLFPVGRGYTGERQREVAYRFGINLIMHVLTGNYKSDQVHVPALLDRLGQ